ncbi:MAG: VWA domain-containing protein [Clostridiales bacterium]|nr:VWA domain-containing protein [Clostridiales bacterium]
MTNFVIHFNNSPWLFLLLIPAFFLALFPYFRLAKRYRRTRNRITSIVLHCIVMVLCTVVLVGVWFSYDVPNAENEVIILVDASHSGREADVDRDDFVRDLIAQSNGDFKLGVVTFGYNQVYAVPLSANITHAYDTYLNAEKPDDSASDIAAALSYAGSLFEKPETAKIVLLSDGLETDGNAITAVKLLAAQGIKVDTAVFSGEHSNSEVQLMGVTLPDYNIVAGDLFTLGLSIQSSYRGTAVVTLKDSILDEESGEFVDAGSSETEVNLTNRTLQEISIEYSFEKAGMHRLYFSIASSGDTLTQNNGYYTYIDLQVYDNILIIERYDKEAERLQTLLKTRFENVDVLTITDEESLPKNVNDLREYDQVILMNIANEDMPLGFDQILYSYVHDFGGGMLTVGGNKQGTDTPNAYDRSDMIGTVYQDMLPVEAINYTPPLGVVIIIDRSGSMSSVDDSTGKTILELAKEGAKSCLNALTERDYCSVMTLEDEGQEKLTLTPLTQYHKIVAAIDNIENTGGGTNYTNSIKQAGRMLRAVDVERRHIILVSDGQPTDDNELYQTAVENNFNNDKKVTFSCVVVGNSPSKAHEIEVACQMGGGEYYRVTDGTQLTRFMREDLNRSEIKDVIIPDGGITPVIGEHNSVVSGVLKLLAEEGNVMPNLYGYYGTKLRSGLTAILMGEFVPIYAQWKYGAGMVGSFMCDLSGVWSDEFMNSNVGQEFIFGAINALFPTDDIRPNDIDVTLNELNYSTQVNIYTNLDNGQTLDVEITAPIADDEESAPVKKMHLTAVDNYSRITFTNERSGLHKLTIIKRDADGNILGEYSTYRAFSYSAEYDEFVDAADGEDLMARLAQSGRGAVVDEAVSVFEGIEKTTHKTYDPRIPLIIIAIILFLLDIAVRKFKFKWPHELIREYKEKKEKSSADKR